MVETIHNEPFGSRPISSLDRQAQVLHALLTEHHTHPLVLFSLLASDRDRLHNDLFSTLAQDFEIQNSPPPTLSKDEKRWFISAYRHNFGIDALRLGLNNSIKIVNDDTHIVPYIHFIHGANTHMQDENATFYEQHNINYVEFYILDQNQIMQFRELIQEAQ